MRAFYAVSHSQEDWPVYSLLLLPVRGFAHPNVNFAATQPGMKRNPRRLHGGTFDFVHVALTVLGLQSFEDFAVHALLRGQFGGRLHHVRKPFSE